MKNLLVVSSLLLGSTNSVSLDQKNAADTSNNSAMSLHSLMKTMHKQDDATDPDADPDAVVDEEAVDDTTTDEEVDDEAVADEEVDDEAVDDDIIDDETDPDAVDDEEWEEPDDNEAAMDEVEAEEWEGPPEEGDAIDVWDDPIPDIDPTLGLVAEATSRVAYTMDKRDRDELNEKKFVKRITTFMRSNSLIPEGMSEEDLKPELQQVFEDIDIDGSGTVNKEELLQNLFAMVDTDGNGKLDEAEMTQFFESYAFVLCRTLDEDWWATSIAPGIEALGDNDDTLDWPELQEVLAQEGTEIYDLRGLIKMISQPIEGEGQCMLKWHKLDRRDRDNGIE